MIKSLKVEGLNHRINVDLNFNEDLNIITGKNGSGKTTLLKLLWYLISGNLGQIIREIPFQDVFIETDSFSLGITQIEPDSIRVTSKFSGEKVSGGIGTVEEFEEQKLEEWSRKILNSTNGSLFFPTFRRIEGGFSGRGSRSFTPTLFLADLEGFQSERPNRRFTDRATERLQEAMTHLSAGLSAHDHKFIASISTHDIVALLTEKYAAIYRTTNALNVQLSQEITQRISETTEHDDAILVLNGIQERVKQVAEERDALLRPFSVLDERIPEIFHYDGIRVTPGIVLGEENEENEAIASDKLSSGEKQMLSFSVLQRIQREYRYFH